jgi:hypothetical protein
MRKRRSLRVNVNLDDIGDKAYASEEEEVEDEEVKEVSSPVTKRSTPKERGKGKGKGKETEL